jgi:hypothetical protein
MDLTLLEGQYTRAIKQRLGQNTQKPIRSYQGISEQNVRYFIIYLFFRRQNQVKTEQPILEKLI